MAAPSMLMVLPSGMEKEDTDRDAPSFWTLRSVVERAAALEQVVKAIIIGEARPLRKRLGVRPVIFTHGR